MTGIRTIDDIRDRCRVDDITGCWHWGGGRGNGQPMLRLPELGRVVTLGTAIGTLLTGREPKRGVFWYCTCETTHCANPRHRKSGTRSQQMLAANLTCNPVHRARIAATKRAASRLTEQAAADIRMSAEPQAVLAARHGVSRSQVSRVQRGELWRPLGNSAFNSWRWLEAA